MLGFPPKIHMLNLNFHENIQVGSADSDQVMRTELWWKGFMSLQRDPGGCHCPSHRVRIQWEASCPWTRRGSGRHRICSPGPPASRTVLFLLATWFLVLHYSITKGWYTGHGTEFYLLTLGCLELAEENRCAYEKAYLWDVGTVLYLDQVAIMHLHRR